MSARLLPSQSWAELQSQRSACSWAELGFGSELAASAASPSRKASASSDATRMAISGAASIFEQELASVQAELERVRAQAEASASASYKSGFDDGYRQGIAKNQTELEGYRQEIAASLQAAEIARRELLESAEADLVRLSIAVAEKILNRQIQMDATALEGVVKTALDRLAGKPVQCVRLHPEDHTFLEKSLAQLGAGRALRLLPDATLSRGSLLFETEHGTLDASISTQLEEIESGLVDRLRRSHR